MKALQLIAPNQLEFTEMPMPEPKKGEVIVKIAYAPVNPSDLAFLTGQYGIKKPYPVVPGLEGSGTVVESGGGILASLWQGKRVACSPPNDGDGTWAEYMRVPAAQCIPLNKNVSLEQGSMLFVNPLTALGFIKRIKEGNHQAVVLTAAASALCKMVLHIAKQEGIKVIGIVRRQEQADELMSLGIDKALISDSPDFFKELKETAKALKATIAFDAIGGGDLPAQILHNMPPKSRWIIYGRLEYEKPGLLIPEDFIFNEYHIEGYWLSKEVTRKSLFQTIIDTRKVQKVLGDGFETNINRIVKPEEVFTALADYQKNMSAGKMLIGF
jgi:NADPH:quinone reductase-like Zn-dependent oxidoreductase